MHGKVLKITVVEVGRIKLMAIKNTWNTWFVILLSFDNTTANTMAATTITKMVYMRSLSSLLTANAHPTGTTENMSRLLTDATCEVVFINGGNVRESETDKNADDLVVVTCEQGVGRV